MRTPTLPASRIAEMLDGTIEGDPDVLLSGFSSIENGKASDLTYMGNARYEDFVYTTNAGAILVRYDFEPKAPYTATLIRVSDPYDALNHLVELLKAESTEETGVSPLAVVDDTVEVSEDVYIGPLAYVGAYTKLGKGVRILPHVYVGKECQIGDHTKIYPMAVVSDHTVIGERCIIHSGSVIGADGFGFAPTETGYEKVPQMGNVVIEDDVEIGANTCIDRAAIDSTIVKKGAKVDNLVQLAHNTVTGAHTVISAQTGVAGSTKIGDWNVLAGQVGVAGHLTTADKVTLAAKTGVLASIKDVGGTYFGIPAQPHRTAMKAAALFPHLPEIDKELYQLKFEVESLKKELEDLKSKRK